MLGHFANWLLPICEEADRDFCGRFVARMHFHLFGKQFLKFLDAVPTGEIDKAFAAIALCQIDLQHMLQQRGQFVKGDTSKNFTGDCLFFSETATEDHVVTFDRIAALIHLRPEQADVAHVVLGARIRATGQMNVNRLIELQFLFQMARQENSMAFGVGGCPLASGVSGASDESAGDCGRRVMETHLDQILFHRLDEMVRHIGDDEILPDGQANLPGAVILRHVGDAAHLLRGHPAHRNNRTDIIKARLNLFKHSNVAVLNRRLPRLALVERKTQQRKG